MNKLQSFHLGDILSITTGFLVSPTHMTGVCAILDFLMGSPLWTHQLPRARQQCAPVLLEQHPALVAVQVPEDRSSSAWVDPWLAEQVATYGEYLEVSPLAPAQRDIRDPLTELIGMVGPEKVIVVEATP